MLPFEVTSVLGSSLFHGSSFVPFHMLFRSIPFHKSQHTHGIVPFPNPQFGRREWKVWNKRL